MNRFMSMWLLAGAMSLAGCTELQLRPAAPLETDESAAQVEGNGVHILARTGAWRSHPVELESVLTPVFVEVRNDGNQPLRLKAPDGRKRAAVPPFELRKAITRSIGAAYSDDVDRDSLVAPLWQESLPRSASFKRPLSEERFADSTRYRRQAPSADSVTVGLPTQPMVEHALPEAVVKPGGVARGFLYFDKIEQPGQVTLEMDVTPPTSGERHTLRIGFVSREGFD